tara:strand:+ start:359 stop:568 length:210 start_codon:yes stop_codon:yes gene_type:complete
MATWGSNTGIYGSDTTKWGEGFFQTVFKEVIHEAGSDVAYFEDITDNFEASTATFNELKTTFTEVKIGE